MKLSVIIPVYNEESTIGEIIQRVLDVPFEKEVIIVDDGSRDQTRTIVERTHSENLDTVKVFVTPTNFGKGAAIRIGLQFVTGDIVIIQDADLELDPGEYVNLVRPIQEGKADVVYGSRFLEKNPRISWKTRAVNKALASFTNVLFNINITDESTCYKVFRADLIKDMPLDCVGFEFCPEVTAKLARMKKRIVEVPIGYHPRNASEGKKLRFFRHGSQAVLTLMRYRFWKPLKKSLAAASTSAKGSNTN